MTLLPYKAMVIMSYFAANCHFILAIVQNFMQKGVYMMYTIQKTKITKYNKLEFH